MTRSKRGICDWCGGSLMKMRDGVLKHITGSRPNNYICDACWKAHVDGENTRKRAELGLGVV